ncbi:MAG: hypothetical protein EPN69_11850 [Rhodanobacter sp.]|nr:MAG: hypothetical protein EPN69_11850 [Rhodanobacter sp.]TAL97714.1 MAG: hypothetical protein EPN71_08645 [Rhodanobacter sp.]TAM42082.1 MAG: hypothetical protein EPN58_04295 [Rhodanobacter sp.]
MLLRMARPPRLDIAGIPQHVVQRGNNWLRCFLHDEAREITRACSMVGTNTYRDAVARALQGLPGGFGRGQNRPVCGGAPGGTTTTPVKLSLTPFF